MCFKKNKKESSLFFTEATRLMRLTSKAFILYIHNQYSELSDVTASKTGACG